jgi:hypothetical protein
MRKTLDILPLFLSAAFLLFGCDQQAIFDKMVPQEEASTAKRLISKVAAREFTAVEDQLSPNLRSPENRAKLEEISRAVPAREPIAVKTVGAHTMHNASRTTYDLTFEYRYPDSWLLANVVLERADGKLTVQGLHLTPRTVSLEAENSFTFQGKGPLHYLVFALAVAIPIFIVYALTICIRTKIPKRKWLWLLFVAIGLVQFQFNWSNGAWDINPISFSLLGAGFVKAGPVAPYIFTVAFPLGAILFLARRHSSAQRNDA